MSWLSSFLNPGKGYEKGQEQLNKFYNQAQSFQQPYNQNAQNQYGNLNEYIMALMDPEALQNKWADGYTESESAKNAERMAQEHGLDVASSMGLMGSNTALQATQAGATQIGLNDRQNYLDNLMQKYLAGANLAQGIYGQGSSAAGQMGQNAMNMGNSSAEMAYGKQNAGGNMLAGLIGQGIGAISGPAGSSLLKNWNLSGGM